MCKLVTFIQRKQHHPKLSITVERLTAHMYSKSKNFLHCHSSERLPYIQSQVLRLCKFLASWTKPVFFTSATQSITFTAARKKLTTSTVRLFCMKDVIVRWTNRQGSAFQTGVGLSQHFKSQKIEYKTGHWSESWCRSKLRVHSIELPIYFHIQNFLYAFSTFTRWKALSEWMHTHCLICVRYERRFSCIPLKMLHSLCDWNRAIKVWHLWCQWLSQYVCQLSVSEGDSNTVWPTDKGK